MKVEFDAPIDNGDVIIKSVNTEHVLVNNEYITVTFTGRMVKSLPINGLSSIDLSIHNAWLNMIANISKAEFQTQEITKRHQEKTQENQ